MGIGKSNATTYLALFGDDAFPLRRGLFDLGVEYVGALWGLVVLYVSLPVREPGHGRLVDGEDERLLLELADELVPFLLVRQRLLGFGLGLGRSLGCFLLRLGFCPGLGLGTRLGIGFGSAALGHGHCCRRLFHGFGCSRLFRRGGLLSGARRRRSAGVRFGARDGFGRGGGIASDRGDRRSVDLGWDGYGGWCGESCKDGPHALESEKTHINMGISA